MQTGRVGAYSMYVRKGEQIVRQRRNSSNYGAEASRTEAQQARRIKWANIVNFYKACKAWMPKAFENKKTGQTDYNAFMSANIERGNIYLTKAQAAEGCCVLDRLIVSKGSLPAMDCDWQVENYQFSTGLRVATAFPSGVTVGWLSQQIINDNIGWQQGDNLAFVYFMLDYGTSPSSPEDRRPRVYSRYLEMTIDVDDSRVITLHPLAKWMSLDSNNSLQIGGEDLLDGWYGAACIHTRISGQLVVSTQEVMLITDEFIDDFSTQEFKQICMDSYGVSAAVPLDPSFTDGAITEILANGSPVTRDMIYDSTVNLTVKGENMLGHVTLDNGSVTYTPLSVSADGGEWSYILSSDGVYTVRLNGRKVRTVTIEGIVIPDELAEYRQMWMINSDSASINAEGRFNVEYARAQCINYAHKTTAESRFVLSVRFSEAPSATEDFEFINCSKNSEVKYNEEWRINVSVTDSSSVAYITYKSLIIAVFNYS